MTTKGRPRPEDTVARDNRVLAALKQHGPQSRNDLANRLNEAYSLVYLSLTRLRDTEQVKRCLNDAGDTVWSAAVEEPC
jgi:predicted transcriptional regulator